MSLVGLRRHLGALDGGVPRAVGDERSRTIAAGVGRVDPRTGHVGDGRLGKIGWPGERRGLRLLGRGLVEVVDSDCGSVLVVTVRAGSFSSSAPQPANAPASTSNPSSAGAASRCGGVLGPGRARGRRHRWQRPADLVGGGLGGVAERGHQHGEAAASLQRLLELRGQPLGRGDQPLRRGVDPLDAVCRVGVEAGSRLLEVGRARGRRPRSASAAPRARRP